MEYRIKSIKHSGRYGIRGIDRTDGRYPIRIGRIVDFDVKNVTVGYPLILSYMRNPDGSDYSGHYLRCSNVTGIYTILDNSLICVETKNSIYEIEKVE